MKQEIGRFITGFFAALNAHDKAAVMQAWHPEGTLVINGVRQEHEFLTGLPAFVGFDLQDLAILKTHKAYCVCNCQWQMMMPGGQGSHDTMLILIPEGQSFKILSMTDFGEEN